MTKGIFLIQLSFLCFSVCFGQESSLIDREISYIDSCLISSKTNEAKDQRIIAFGALMKDLFNFDILRSEEGPILFILEKEYNDMKDLVAKNKDLYSYMIDTEIKKLFTYHRQSNLKTDMHLLSKEFNKIICFHYLDNSIDNHILDFKQICKFHLSSISKQKTKDGLYRCSREGDVLFLWCINALGFDKTFDPHTYKVSGDYLKELKAWCVERCSDSTFDSKLLNVLTEFLIEINFQRYTVNYD